ncbi:MULTISPECIES: branched-chain amino acid ABC transporter permease [Carnobacterium]|jgi:branched-chain amino acid transport system permease protein|uniref:Branched-chain amino acid ABC transporter permease n=1 Tax=Carnobacterium inhibens TaxID=147709 RepID=A0ABR7TCY5_9LACT|nr:MULTISPECIES: branched-chain amino acid ABC transporter permease [Carnobacterium]MBC9825826.1 branched-chain amino acid ABC transporter permease [Carnobacterium inhibens]MDN5371403.1 branched-chain amino acid transport system permease protein [Carnobacterium sp.]
MKQFNKKNLGWLIFIAAIYILIQLGTSLGIINAFYEITLMTILINVILATGLNLIIGFSGQFSLGHAGFMAIGAYCTGIVSIKYPTVLGLIGGILLGIIIASLVALLVGIPTLRLKGDYLAIATLGVAEIIRIVILNMNDLTNGAAGLSGIPFIANWQITFAFIVISLIVIMNYIKSSPGRATISIREDEIAAESMGINTTKYKIIAFVLGAASAAIAGGLHASYFSVIRPSDFTFMKSVDILIIVVFGGLGSMTGSVVAAIVLGILNIYLQPFGQLRMIIYSVALVAIMVFKPSGLLGTKEFTISGLLDRKNKKSSVKEGEAE